MNVKQFKYLIKRAEETKASKVYLSEGGIFTAERNTGNIMYSLDASSTPLYYLVSMQPLLDIAKKLKATKEDISFTFQGSILTLATGLAAFDVPASSLSLSEGGRVEAGDLNADEAEAVRQLLITAGTLPVRDEMEFIPAAALVHVFIDSGLTLEVMDLSSDLQAFVSTSLKKRVRAALKRTDINAVLKPLKALGYADSASVCFRKNGSGAKMNITFHAKDMNVSFSFPMSKKEFDTPAVPRFEMEDTLVLADTGAEEGIREQLASLNLFQNQKQLLAVEREFPDTLEVGTDERCTVISSPLLQHCFGSAGRGAVFSPDGQ